jgi:hypothetical protein
MRMRLSLLLLGVLASPLRAETLPTDCATLSAALGAVPGYRLTVPPQGDAEGWCVLDGAKFSGDAPPRVDATVDQLRLRGEGVDGQMTLFAVDLAGLRLRPKLADREMDDRLRGLMRLQSADLAFEARLDPASGLVSLSDLALELSGGTQLEVSAELAGGGLSIAQLAAGRLTALRVIWHNDGRLLRPILEMSAPDLSGSKAVDAARAKLAALVESLPGAAIDDDSRAALKAMVKALPQGRGRLVLDLDVPDGIGAARLLVAGMAEDPLAPEALAALLDGAKIAATWEPGIAP